MDHSSLITVLSKQDKPTDEPHEYSECDATQIGEARAHCAFADLRNDGLPDTHATRVRHSQRCRLHSSFKPYASALPVAP